MSLLKAGSLERRVKESAGQFFLLIMLRPRHTLLHWVLLGVLPGVCVGDRVFKENQSIPSPRVKTLIHINDICLGFCVCPRVCVGGRLFKIN